MLKTIRHYFPDFFERMSLFKDQRKRKDYSVAELVTGCIALFLFKEGSRNAINNDRKEVQFRDNYFRLFKLRLPHMDTVEDFLRQLDCDTLELLKAAMISQLMEQKVLHKFKLLDKYFMVAIDGTGVNSYACNDKEKTRVHKTSKNGKTSYHSYVLEAKLVTASGLSISLASEWIENDAERNFDKQDCELRAFVRLAAKLKKHFPRLPICILADGLYPNNTFMETCAANGWQYITVLKDENLKTLQTDIVDIENKHRHEQEHIHTSAKGMVSTNSKYLWIDTALEHKNHKLYWVSCMETRSQYCKSEDGKVVLKKENVTKFVWLTSLVPDAKTVGKIAQGGRMRWKIENEGYNTQKNNGYALGHLFSRDSFSSYKNYYQCLQIAHCINQLTEHSREISDLLEADAKLTVTHLWKMLNSTLIMAVIEEIDNTENKKRCQIRLRKRKPKT